jgi:molybdenum cofactor biosynthesis protein B
MTTVEEHRRLAPEILSYAVITVSDSRGEAEESGGRKIVERIVQAAQRPVHRAWVQDDIAAIRAAVLEALALPEVDVVVLTGGTGFSPRDVTVEAVSPLFDRTIDGFGELFRALSYGEVGAAAMLSRAVGGLVANRAVFAVPGSPKAAALALDKLILPEAGHLLSQARRPSAGRNPEPASAGR